MSETGSELKEGAITWRDASTRAQFAALGMRVFDDFVGAKGLETVKATVAWKRIYRGGATSGPRHEDSRDSDRRPVFYLKIFDGVPAGERRRQRWSRGIARSAASREWEALRHLEAAGLRAPRALAVGEEKSGLFGEVRRAFVVTAAIPAGPSLEELVEDQAAAWMSASRRRRLARRIGGLLGRMHASGLNHRDFYAGHLRVDAEDQPWVLDLDRAQLRAEVPRRWRVKDLAALDFSVPARLVGDDLRALCLAAYRRQGPRTDPRAFVAEIKAKSASMRRRARKKIARGDSNIHINE
jgi:lipopolysaccharide core heptose(I) kinase